METIGGTVIIDIPDNGCYHSIFHDVGSNTSKIFIKFTPFSGGIIDRLIQYTKPVKQPSRVSNYFKLQSLETSLSILPLESLYQFYNNCDFAFNEYFYSMSIEEKREYLSNKGLNPECWNEDNFYFTSNNLVNTLLSMSPFPFSIFYHNYFVQVDNIFYDLKNPKEGQYSFLPPPVDGKQNILINKFVSTRKTQYFSSISDYMIMPIEFTFNMEDFVDITTSIEYDFVIEQSKLTNFIKRYNEMVFPSSTTIHYNNDGTTYTRTHTHPTLDFVDYLIVRHYGEMSDWIPNYVYDYNSPTSGFVDYGFFDGFLVIAVAINYFGSVELHSGTKYFSDFKKSVVTYHRILTSFNFVEGSGNSFDDVVGEDLIKKCCIAECFGITN